VDVFEVTFTRGLHYVKSTKSTRERSRAGTVTHICRHTLEIHAVRELVDFGNLEYPAFFVSRDPNAVSGYDIPVFNTVMWFDCLDHDVFERMPLQVAERKGLQVTKVFCPWVARDCTANLGSGERHDTLRRSRNDDW
jgi:hypothetical protein